MEGRDWGVGEGGGSGDNQGQRPGVCSQVGDLPPSVIQVHMVVVGCPISFLRTNYSAHQMQKEPTLRCPRPFLSGP